MQSMNISLPDPMKRFVDGQISTGRYGSGSEYVRELIRNDEKHKAEGQLEAKLLEGLSSAETELTPAGLLDVAPESRCHQRFGALRTVASQLRQTHQQRSPGLQRRAQQWPSQSTVPAVPVHRPLRPVRRLPSTHPTVT